MIYSISSVLLLTTSILAIPKPKPYSSSNRASNPFVYHDNDIVSPVQNSASTSSTSSQKANTFVVGKSTGASAQQLFLGSTNKVYIVDKTENNTAQINGHPAVSFDRFFFSGGIRIYWEEWKLTINVDVNSGLLNMIWERILMYH